MRLGIGSWTFPWGIGFTGFPAPEKPVGAEDLLYKAKSLGVGLVQICDNLPLHEMSDAELLQLKRASEELDISLQIGTRGVEPGYLSRYLEIAEMLDSKLVRTITDTSGCKPALGQVVSWIREVMPDFEKKGVSIAIENHDRFKVAELAEIIERIGSPNAGICLDTVNSFGALECPAKVMAELSPYTINLHIKDFEITRIKNAMGFVIRGCPAGSGQLDIDMVFNELLKHGRKPDVILEQWVPFEESVEKTIELENIWADKGIEFLMERLKTRRSRD